MLKTTTGHEIRRYQTYFSQAQVVVLVTQLHTGDTQLIARELLGLESEHVPRPQRGVLLHHGLLQRRGLCGGRHRVLGRQVLGARQVDVEVVAELAYLAHLAQLVEVLLEQLDVLRRAFHDLNLEGPAVARLGGRPGQPPATGHGQVPVRSTSQDREHRKRKRKRQEKKENEHKRKKQK
jgi:hypothetical protein